MSKSKVLVKVHPEGRYVVGLDKSIDIAKVTVGARVALRNDSYTLHVLLPTKARPPALLLHRPGVPRAEAPAAAQRGQQKCCLGQAVQSGAQAHRAASWRAQHRDICHPERTPAYSDGVSAGLRAQR